MSYDDVLDWVAIRMAFDECDDSARTVHAITGHMAEAIADHNTNIELRFVALQPPDDAGDMLNGTGVWTFTWTGRVSSSHPLHTRAALKEIMGIGRAASAQTEIHQFDTDEVPAFYESPLMAIETAMANEPTSETW